MHHTIVSWVKCHWCRWLCPRWEDEEPQWAIDVELEAIDWLRWEGEKLAHDAVDLDPHLTSRLRTMLKLVQNDANEDALNQDSLKVFKSAFQAIPFWIKHRKNSLQDYIFGSEKLVCRIEFHCAQAREASRLAKKRRREAKTNVTSSCHGLLATVPASSWPIAT